MCLAPCFAGCTKEDYDVEVGRVVRTLATAGEALTEELEHEREAASEALDFERASNLHKRLEKVSSHLRTLPEIARRIDMLDAVILQRAAEEKTIIAFPVLSGILREPIFLKFAELASEPRSVEVILRAGLEPQTGTAEPQSVPDGAEPPAKALAPAAPVKQAHSPTSPDDFAIRSVPGELPEHLSLVARWFYSKPRDGEIFFRDFAWPYRRILRACSRLLAPPVSQTLPQSSDAEPRSK